MLLVVAKVRGGPQMGQGQVASKVWLLITADARLIQAKIET
jgi:hypothetical protein